MSLVGSTYDSSSTETESEADSEPKSKIPKLTKKAGPKIILPAATAQLGPIKAKAHTDEDEHDDPTKHGGRLRSFKHQRGNWATYVYLPVDIRIFEDAQEVCQEVLPGLDLQPCEDLHISLSRTVVLQYHLIDSFIRCLQRGLRFCTKFVASLRPPLKAYTNEEKTRTFIAFEVDQIYLESFNELLRHVNEVMRDFMLPLFYENPSFHISFLWCLGDRVEYLKPHLKSLEDGIRASNGDKILTVAVKNVACKSGNKDFVFALQ